MRRVMKWRYYCDYCKKATMTKSSMEKHEKGCTLNPDRVCGLCAIIGNAQESIETLKTTPLKDLRDLTDGCPACILAAIRQRNKGEHPEDWEWLDDFDFKAEMKIFWDEYNDTKYPQY